MRRFEEGFGITEFNVDEFKETEAEKYNQKYPEIEIPDEVEDDIDNDYDIRDNESEGGIVSTRNSYIAPGN